MNKDVTELNFTVSISVLFTDQCILLKRFDFVVQDNISNLFHDSRDISCFHTRDGQIISEGRIRDVNKLLNLGCCTLHGVKLENREMAYG